MGERAGDVIELEGGPWDGQEVFVPTRPRYPDSISFPVQWHDGTWDNAHWQWLYVLRGVGGPHAPYVYQCVGTVPARGLTPKEREEQEAKKDELLAGGAEYAGR